MLNEKTPNECPLNHEQAYKLLNEMESAKKAILDMSQSVEKCKDAADDMPEVKKMVKELHEKLLKANSFVDGTKVGMRIGAVSVLVVIGTSIVMIYLFLSGKLSLKDLLAWLT